MANPNRPYGFLVADSEGAAFRAKPYKKQSGSAIFMGDVVKRNAAGTVEVATAGDIIVGVAAEYKAATSTDDILVYDDEDCIFECMALGSFAQSDVFLNANIDATTGDTLLLTSRQSLALSTKNTTSSLQFVILGIVTNADNELGSFARIKVKPNSHFLKNGVTGL